MLGAEYQSFLGVRMVGGTDFQQLGVGHWQCGLCEARSAGKGRHRGLGAPGGEG